MDYILYSLPQQTSIGNFNVPEVLDQLSLNLTFLKKMG